MNRAEVLTSVSNIVVKVGTNALTHTDGRLDHEVIHLLATDIAGLCRKKKFRVTLVSSGAIGAGMAELNLPVRPKDLSMLQATAAVGQSLLMRYFADAFKPHGLHAGQILVTRHDFEDRLRYLNLRNCIHALQQSDCIPIINENDPVAVDEIRFGDNDLIAAHVTNMLQADLLILLSVVDGLLDAQGRVQELVTEMDETVTGMVREEKSSRGTGGMTSKLMAAGTVQTAGEPVIIANGKTPGIIGKLLAGEPLGTLIMPGKRRLSARSRWIALTAKTRGAMVVDAGAAAALRDNKSLLAGGIVSVSGDFGPGDAVAIEDAAGKLVAHGLTNYSRVDVEKIKGYKSRDFGALLGSDTWHDEVVHRDDLVIYKSP
jgi:glutamate 5-kinase